MPYPSPTDLPEPGIEPVSPAWAGGFLTTEQPGKGITHTHTHTHIYTPQLLYHSSVNGHLGCFHVLAIVNGAVMNIGVHVSFRIVVFSGYIPSSGIVGSYGSFIPSF